MKRIVQSTNNQMFAKDRITGVIRFNPGWAFKAAFTTRETLPKREKLRDKITT